MKFISPSNLYFIKFLLDDFTIPLILFGHVENILQPFVTPSSKSVDLSCVCHRTVLLVVTQCDSQEGKGLIQFQLVRAVGNSTRILDGRQLGIATKKGVS